MVYIASSSMTAVSRQSTLQIQSALSDVQTEAASGVYADVGLTLGSRSGELVALQNQQASLTAYQTNNGFAATRLSSTVTALDTISSAASSFLSALTTASSSGGLTTSLQTSAANSLSALTAALNTSVSGQYIFAGINTAAEPVTTYTQSPASANKSAVDAAFASAFGVSQTSAGAGAISAADMGSFLSGPFADMFSATGFGATWSSASDQTITSEISPNQTISTSVSANAAPFRQLAEAYTMVTEFGGSNLSSGASQAVVSSALSLVSSAIAGLTTTEAGVGDAQNAVTNADTALAAQSDVIKTQTDGMVGVDQEALSTRLANLQTQLNASYSITAQLEKLSLVNYLA